MNEFNASSPDEQSNEPIETGESGFPFHLDSFFTYLSYNTADQNGEQNIDATRY